MRQFGKAKALGVTVGVALLMFVAVRSSEGDLKPGPIDPAVAAPAEQLGKAFAMVAAHVRPAVVSVYSTKMVKVPEFRIPFGNDFFRQFFGRQFPQNPAAAEAARVQRAATRHGLGHDY